MRLLIMGPPGAGKGTQASILAEHLGIPTISTGSIFRSLDTSTPRGREIKAIMDSGEYVPDEVVDEVVATRLQQPDAAKGWLLDGYPRTLPQVKALDEMMGGEPLDGVICLDADLTEVARRLLERAQIEGRADDTAETIQRRLEVYQTSTAPLLDHYREAGVLLTVDGNGTVPEVTEHIRAALDALPGRR